VDDEQNSFPLEFEPVLAAGAGQIPARESLGASPSLAGGPPGLRSPCCGCHCVKHFPSQEELKDPLVGSFIALRRALPLSLPAFLLPSSAQAGWQGWREGCCLGARAFGRALVLLQPYKTFSAWS